jgi:hypothetical protein
MRFARVIVATSVAMMPFMAPAAYAGDGPGGSGEGGEVYCRDTLDEWPFADGFDSEAAQISGESCKSISIDGADGGG